MQNVQRIVSQLEIVEVDSGTPESWIAESADLAETVAYDPIVLPESYMKRAGEIARERIVAAGMRLAGLLNDDATRAKHVEPPGPSQPGYMSLSRNREPGVIGSHDCNECFSPTPPRK